MSNMTLKDWRENAERLARRSRKHWDAAAFREYLMLAATALSALATACTGAIAYYQYQTAHEQLTAADRNRSFEGFLTTVHQMCNVLANNAIRLSDLNGHYGPDSDDLFRSFGTELNPVLEDLRAKLSVLLIWADKPQQRLVISFYGDIVHTVEKLKEEASPGRGSLHQTSEKNAWVLAALVTAQSCGDRSITLVEDYRGEDLLKE